mmetsp:Transcript_31697/g.54044  ORF Transcript_31697/g.54044 Transcript_31697/m.54044 type:complete len:447 (+) Transcript_31697:153-1493(+)
MKRRRIATSPAAPGAGATFARMMITTAVSVLVVLSITALKVEAFTSPPSLQPKLSPSINQAVVRPQLRTPFPSRSSSTTSLNLLGSDGGILGVGAPEVAVTLIVGYLVLGPSDLYKLVKEVGKFIQNFRTLGTEAAKQFEGTMENQLELTELRKAQAELNDAFSFRRSINTYEDGQAFGATSFSENAAAASTEFAAAGAGAATATATAGAATAEGATTAEGAPVKKKRRLVRRKKKKAAEPEPEEINVPSPEEIYPDLDMLDAELTEEEKLRAERLERLSGGETEQPLTYSSSSSSSSSSTSSEPDWFTASEEEIASQVLENDPLVKDPALDAFEKNRFQSQLSAEDWNAQIMANEDQLAPLSMVMKRLAILEEEKNAADKRLEEEYQKRMDNEDKFYLEKRRVLEEAIVEIQEGVYANKNGEGEGEESGIKEKKEAEENVPKFSA